MLDPTTRATLLYALNYVLEDYRSGVVVEDPPVIRDKLIAAIAALEKGGEWQPVEHYKWQEHIDMGGNKPDHWQEIEITGRMIEMRSVGVRLVTLLPHNMGVYQCRFVPAAP